MFIYKEKLNNNCYFNTDLSKIVTYRNIRLLFFIKICEMYQEHM